jgi:hypothetical protein
MKHALCMVSALLAFNVAWAQSLPTGELRVQLEEHRSNDTGPLADALNLAPGLSEITPRAGSTQLELKHRLRLPTPEALPRTSLNAQALLRHEWPKAQRSRDASRMNELNLSTEVGSFGFTAGKKVLGWDVGYAFRPNDVVQQEERRSLAGTAPEGRPLLMLEHFGRDTAFSLVWVNPNTAGRSQQDAPGAEESALAARGYWRIGTLDLHAFGRVGDRTRASAGIAFAWVPGEDTEWHASVRWLQLREGWALVEGTGHKPVASNPWRTTGQGPATQWLVGLNWTGTAQQGLMLEAWHDGTAPSNATWRAWGHRNAALLASPAPAQAVAGNLAWQTTPFAGTNLRQDNLFARASWQPGAWQFWVDALVHPADGGVSGSAGLQWQGDAWRLSASARHYGGKQSALLAQLPYRVQGLFAAARAF